MKQRTTWQNSVSKWSEERLGIFWQPFLLQIMIWSNRPLPSGSPGSPSALGGLQWCSWWAWWWSWGTLWPRWPWSNVALPSGSPGPPSDGLLARGRIRFGQWVKALIWPWAFYGQTGDIMMKKFWQWCSGLIIMRSQLAAQFMPRTVGPWGPTVRGPVVRGPTVRGPTVRGPIVRSPIYLEPTSHLV